MGRSNGFEDASLAPHPALVQTLDTHWVRLGQAGRWWTGTERLALAREARAAHDCALCETRKQAASPWTISEPHAATDELCATAVDTVHRIASDPGRLSARFYREALAGDLLPEQIVELTGVVAYVTLADTLARGCGAARLAFPSPEAGDPSRARVAGTSVDEAWVPMVAVESAEGPLKTMYDTAMSLTGIVFNVMRALSAAPEELFSFFQTFLVSYQMTGDLPDDLLSHPQQELLASATSAANECFY